MFKWLYVRKWNLYGDLHNVILINVNHTMGMHLINYHTVEWSLGNYFKPIILEWNSLLPMWLMKLLPSCLSAFHAVDLLAAQVEFLLYVCQTGLHLLEQGCLHFLGWHLAVQKKFEKTWDTCLFWKSVAGDCKSVCFGCHVHGMGRC